MLFPSTTTASPISFADFPGNTLDHHTLRPAIEETVGDPGSYRISSAHSKGLRRFLKKEYLNKVTGETVNSEDLVPMIDEAKLNEFNELMGYYQIVTSEVGMGDLEVIEKYHGLTQIEDQFREIKATASPF